ncbi:hypothetical protein K443DRAFT_538965 [Laccaria amethystina LaAM-08-1]|uniref:Uncharacterized protein n=1 Tax=Laccaria amethystina LaAM-08-1 TaxID=1095629 RepID=A0A0C9WT84_9AGAR|nr:hypothetical protein K443DRAFT_538965 [Laccaria amethystina LaAM-08-1]
MHKNTMPRVNWSVHISSRMQRLFSNFNEHYEKFWHLYPHCCRSVHPYPLMRLLGAHRNGGEHKGHQSIAAKQSMKSNIMRAADFFWAANNMCDVSGNKVDGFKRCCAERMNVNGYCK